MGDGGNETEVATFTILGVYDSRNSVFSKTPIS